MLRVLLHGLEGPIEGRTYESQMIPQNTNSDAWLADITSYVRNAFGNGGEMVEARQVHRAAQADWRRGRSRGRSRSCARSSPQPLADRKGLEVGREPQSGDIWQRCIDGNPATRWDTSKEQSPGMWFQIELPSSTDIAGT